MSESPKNSWQQLLDDYTMPMGCATVIVMVIVFVVLVVLVYALWVLFTTPSAPPAPAYDPSWGQGVPGFGTDTPTPVPTESWFGW